MKDLSSAKVWCIIPAAFVFLWTAGVAPAFDREDYEEEAGSGFRAVLNTSDDIYGAAIGSGTWLKGCPVLGDYFLGIFHNGIEDALYSNVGLTLRLMPRWTIAPFIGGGGSYNHSLSGGDKDEATPSAAAVEEHLSRGGSYWGGHVEAGLRIWTDNQWRFIEISSSYTWSSEDGDRDYWLAGICVGASP